MDAELTAFEPRRPQTSTSIPTLVTAKELARLWNVSPRWVRHHCRSTCADPLPRFCLGKYPRFDLNDPALAAWLKRRHVGCAK